MNNASSCHSFGGLLPGAYCQYTLDVLHVWLLVAGRLVSVSKMSLHPQVRAAAVLDVHLGETSGILKP